MAGRARGIQAGAGRPWQAAGLPGDAAFVLEFVVSLYDRQLRRIEELDGEVFSGRHRLRPGDVLAVAEAVAGADGGQAVVPGWRGILEAALAGQAVPRA